MTSTEFKKLHIKTFPLVPGRITAESRFWQRFKHPVLVKEFAAVTSINFSPVKPHDFAVTSSTRVQIYSPQTNAVKKTISRFSDVAYSATFRRDGKLLVAGGENGIVQVFDMGSRAVLRSFKGHESAAHVTRFSPNLTQVMSASDDRTVRVWDIPGEEQVIKFIGHEDYIRTGLVSNDNPNILISGSYDHTIKVWDVRSGTNTMTMQHGSPVESLLLFPGGGLLISAGQNVLNVWDILGGGRLLKSLSNHQKTITDMCFDSAHSRFLTASLDHHVKIYNVTDYKVTHSIKYPAPLLALALSPDDTHLVAGMTTGLLSIRRRVVHSSEQVRSSQPKAVHGGTFRFYSRGQSHQAAQDDYKVEERRKPHLRPYDVFLKKFQYKNALDAVLKNQRPIIVVSLLEELSHRDSLRTAISGRDDISLEPLLVFLLRHVTNPRYSALLIDVCNIVLDLYTSVIGQSVVIDELLMKLRMKLRQEVSLQKQLLEVMGTLNMLFAMSSQKETGLSKTLEENVTIEDELFDGVDPSDVDATEVDDNEVVESTNDSVRHKSSQTIYDVDRDDVHSD